MENIYNPCNDLFIPQNIEYFQERKNRFNANLEILSSVGKDMESAMKAGDMQKYKEALRGLSLIPDI